jgi:hypothetical protein
MISLKKNENISRNKMRRSQSTKLYGMNSLNQYNILYRTNNLIKEMKKSYLINKPQILTSNINNNLNNLTKSENYYNGFYLNKKALNHSLSMIEHHPSMSNDFKQKCKMILSSTINNNNNNNEHPSKQQQQRSSSSSMNCKSFFNFDNKFNSSKTIDVETSSKVITTKRKEIFNLLGYNANDNDNEKNTFKKKSIIDKYLPQKPITSTKHSSVHKIEHMKNRLDKVLTRKIITYVKRIGNRNYKYYDKEYNKDDNLEREILLYKNQFD